MTHRRPIFTILSCILLLATLIAWPISYYHNHAFALLKNHRTFSLVSHHGRVSFLYLFNRGPDPRRWSFAVCHLDNLVPARASGGGGAYGGITDSQDLQLNIEGLTADPFFEFNLPRSGYLYWKPFVVGHETTPSSADDPGTSVRLLTLPYWSLAILLSLLPGYFLLTRYRHRAAPGAAPCPHCRYDLRAHSPGSLCPECGHVIPPFLSPTNQIVPFRARTRRAARRLDSSLRRRAPWLITTILLLLILLIETSPRSSPITATLIAEESSPPPWQRDTATISQRAYSKRYPIITIINQPRGLISTWSRRDLAEQITAVLNDLLGWNYHVPRASLTAEGDILIDALPEQHAKAAAILKALESESH